MHQQAALGLLSDSFDRSQSALDLPLATQGAMEGYSEPVSLVPNLHQDLECV